MPLSESPEFAGAATLSAGVMVPTLPMSVTEEPSGKWPGGVTNLDLDQREKTESRETVVASSPDVPDPKYVRYGWANSPQCNLFNGEGLPASPFSSFWPE